MGGNVYLSLIPTQRPRQNRSAPPLHQSPPHFDKQNRTYSIENNVIKTTSPPHQKALMHLIHASHKKRANHSWRRSRKRQPAPRPHPRPPQADHPPPAKQKPQSAVP